MNDLIENIDVLNNYKNQTLKEIVKNDFQTATIFEKYNLDFCCRGNKTILNACSDQNINAEDVLNDLTKILNKKNKEFPSFDKWELDFMIDYIINNHHKYILRMVPIISMHVDKVSSVHYENHPEMAEVAKIFSIVYKDLKQHMIKEEQILFPFIKQLVNAKRNNSKTELPYFGTVKNPIKMMIKEHEAAGDDLYKIRDLTNNYLIPLDACSTFEVCLKELQEFEEDLHKHVHLENNILFPKSVKLEEELIEVL